MLQYGRQEGVDVLARDKDAPGGASKYDSGYKDRVMMGEKNDNGKEKEQK